MAKQKYRFNACAWRGIARVSRTSDCLSVRYVDVVVPWAYVGLV